MAGKNKSIKVKGEIRRKFSWQRPLIGLVLLIFVIIVLLKFAELQQIASLLKKINWWWFCAALIAQFAVFGSLAGLYKTLLKEKGNRRNKNGISFWYLLKSSIAMVFVDHILPSFSASGNVLLYHIARKKKIKEGRASLLVALNIFLNVMFYFAIFIAGLIYLLISKQIIGFQWIWILTVFILIFGMLLIRILFTATGQRHFKKVMKWLLRKWPRAQARTSQHLSRLYRAKKEIKKGILSLAFVFTFLVYLFKIAVIWFVFLSLGKLINLGVLLTGYFITAFLSALSYIRIGVYELAMIGAYTGLGVEYNLAFTATLLYRFVAFWLPMLFGFFFFRNLIRKDKRADKKIIKTARSLIGKKYKYGTSLKEAPELFDCSSFIQFIFKQSGINLPRSTIKQIEKGKTIQLNKLMPCDLIFIKGSKFHTNEKWPDGVGHVALYIGNKQIIHAEGSRHKKVVLEKLSKLNLNKNNFRAVKRIL